MENPIHFFEVQRNHTYVIYYNNPHQDQRIGKDHKVPIEAWCYKGKRSLCWLSGLNARVRESEGRDDVALSLSIQTPSAMDTMSVKKKLKYGWK